MEACFFSRSKNEIDSRVLDANQSLLFDAFQSQWHLIVAEYSCGYTDAEVGYREWIFKTLHGWLAQALRSHKPCLFFFLSLGLLFWVVKPDADPSQKNSPQVDKCSMLFEGSWWSDGPVTPGGVSNSKYSDLMKQYAIDIYTASMSAPKGNTSQQLLVGGTPPFPPHTTYMGEYSFLRERAGSLLDRFVLLSY